MSAIPSSAIPAPQALTLPRAGGRALKRALLAGIARVVAERDGLNRINVFPVADGDTGSNLGFTLVAVREALRPLRSGHAGVVLRTVAGEAIDGARGNSGAILAQFLQGFGETLGASARVGAETLAEAAASGAAQARLAVAEPREGTMLSVIAAFARALQAALPTGGDLRAQFTAALAASRAALAATPDQLAVLRKAGVVDAGAQGFVHLLEGIDDFMRRGRHVMFEVAEGAGGEHGVVVTAGFADADADHRWCSECVLSGTDLDRAAVREALARLDGSSLVLAGTREKLRVHMHVDDPGRLFAILSAFGEVRARKADDMQAQQRSAQARGGVAIVVDSAADLPAEAFERLPIHLVPVRVTVGARDYLDKVSLSAEGFHALLRSADAPVRTSQPPPGDFRRLFEFLLSHHDEVVYVGLSRALSGTLQAGESATGPLGARVHVVDTGNVSGGEGLLAMHAAERALAGADAVAIVAAIERVRGLTATFAYVRDLSSAVRGGRVPRWALPITRWLRLVPFVRIGGGDGRLHVRGVMIGHVDLAERFAARVLATLDPALRWRAQVMHCDNRDEAERVRAALLTRRPDIECTDVFDAGSAIAAHAGAGAVALSVMPCLDPDDPLKAEA